MTKEGLVSRAVYKTENATFIVIVESEQAVKEWKKDSSIPLTQVVNAFQVFVGQGAQGILDKPSKQQLENEVCVLFTTPFYLGFSCSASRNYSLSSNQG